jgi:coenzyme PQQ precursor peptide PqqA
MDGLARCSLSPWQSSDTLHEESAMLWETPTYNDVRFGFEVTMYINHR